MVNSDTSIVLTVRSETTTNLDSQGCDGMGPGLTDEETERAVLVIGDSQEDTG